MEQVSDQRLMRACGPPFYRVLAHEFLLDSIDF